MKKKTGIDDGSLISRDMRKKKHKCCKVCGQCIPCDYCICKPAPADASAVTLKVKANIQDVIPGADPFPMIGNRKPTKEEVEYGLGLDKSAPGGEAANGFD